MPKITHMSNLQEWAEYLEANDETFRTKSALLRKEGSEVGPAKRDHINRMVVALIKKRAAHVTRLRLKVHKTRPKGRAATILRLDSALPTGRDVPDFECQDDFEVGLSTGRGVWNQPYESHNDLDGKLSAYHRAGLSRKDLKGLGDLTDNFERLFLGPSYLRSLKDCGTE